MVSIPAKDLAEVKEVGFQLLQTRKHQISDGKINGRHWFLAIIQEAVEVVQNRNAA